jgi:hypothetical protein
MDDAPPGEAVRCLEDLVRINRYLGGHEVLRKTLRRLFRPAETFTMLDVGAASGDTGRMVRGQFPGARVTSLDYRIHHLARASAPRLAADAFRLPVRARAFDVVHAALLLHHFADPQLVDLLRSFGAIARRYVIINDLERNLIARRFLPATRWLFRWHPTIVHDGCISVDAGFMAPELQRLGALAGLQQIDVRVYRPSFRIAMVASPPQAQ